MDTIPETFNNYFKRLYDKKTYLDKYGGSTVFTTIVLVTFFSILSYYYIEANIEPKYLPLSDVNILSKQKSGFILEDSNTFVHLQGRNYKVKQKVSV